MSINKGAVVERIVRTRIGISELSRLLKVSRTSIYNWFTQDNLNIDIICRIGQAISHDFSREFPDDFDQIERQIMADMISSKTEEQLFTNPSQYWINKYIQLLERHNELLGQLVIRTDTHPPGPCAETHSLNCH